MMICRLAFLICLVCASVHAQEDAASKKGLVPTPTFGEAPPPVGTGSTPPPPVDGAAPVAAPAPVEAPAAPAESAIPQTYRDDRYQGTLSKNPFLLKTKTLEQPTASFAQDWELKWMRESKGQIKAGIQNRQTQEYRNIGPEPDAEGFKLVKATIGRNRKDSSAEVAKGAETATLTYSDAPAAPGGGGRPGGGIVPGQPANIPGQRPNAVPPGYRAAGAQQNPATGGVQVANMPGARPGAPVAQPAPGSPSSAAPPNAVNRRRVLIPSPVPPP